MKIIESINSIYQLEESIKREVNKVLENKTIDVIRFNNLIIKFDDICVQLKYTPVSDTKENNAIREICEHCMKLAKIYNGRNYQKGIKEPEIFKHYILDKENDIEYNYNRIIQISALDLSHINDLSQEG